MIVNYTEYERDLLARIMRAEALHEGNLGMMLVGNVVINRVITDCYTFKNINTLTNVIYQKNQFAGINNSLFQGSPTSLEKRLANRVLNGEYYHPATNALWFCATNNNNCKEKWYNQTLAGNYKNHCFYNPEIGACKNLY